MKILISISSEQIGFLVGIGRYFVNKGHDVSFIVSNKINLPDIKKTIKENINGYQVDSVGAISNGIGYSNGKVPYKELAKIESKYNILFSEIVSYSRGLGRGYLLNAEGYPDIIRSWYSQQEKYSIEFGIIKSIEDIISKINPEILIGINLPIELYKICKALDIPTYVIAEPRFGSLYGWAINEKKYNPALDSKIKNNIEYYSNKILDTSKHSMVKTVQMNYAVDIPVASFYKVIKKIIRILFIETYSLIRGTHKLYQHKYRYLGWIAPVIRNIFIYNYICKIGVKNSEILDNKLVLFYMQMEPEISLLNISPELNNSAEVISWISRSLPADYTLVVKEKPGSMSIRTKRYYQNIQRMSNVVFAHPEIPSNIWLDSCSFVSTITGTIGFEAVANYKPVLSFGKHQLINSLPSVVYADNYVNTKSAISYIIKDVINDTKKIYASKESLLSAYNDVCFSMDKYSEFTRSKNVDNDYCITAAEKLISQYPNHNW